MGWMVYYRSWLAEPFIIEHPIGYSLNQKVRRHHPPDVSEKSAQTRSRNLSS